jgi:acyl carrier protein
MEANSVADAKPVVRQFIEATLLPRTEKTQVGDDEPLLDAGLIDSMGIFELATHIENTCGVKIENFNSINDIAAFVNRKRGS